VVGKLLAETAAADLHAERTGKKSRHAGWQAQGELPLRLGRLHEPVPTAETSSNLLARLDAFLPSLKASNEALLDQAARDPDSVDIEHLSPAQEGMEPEHIEMNLGLGVFALKKNDAEAEMPDEVDEADSDDDETGDESSESDASSDNDSRSASVDIEDEEAGSRLQNASGPHSDLDESDDEDDDGNGDGGPSLTAPSHPAILPGPPR